MIDLVLHPGRERSLRRRHPWVLSGAVAHVEEGDGEAGPGAWVRVRAASGEVLGCGHLSPHSSIRVRMLSFGKEDPPPDHLERRVFEAVERRRTSPLLAGSDARRLVNAEGDGLPGLVADLYADTVVLRFTSAGMQARRAELADALRRASGAARGFERADSAAARREGFAQRQGGLWGDAPPVPLEVREGERRYRVDVVSGQKTGFYLDQRDARDLVQALAPGRAMLDLFAYSGGFSVAAAVGGATRVTLVDSSAGALDLARENLAAAAPDVPARLVREDAFRFARRDDARYDLLVVDPPPLARSRGDVPRAARAHKDVLLSALRRAQPGALLLAFSCSHHVGAELLRKVAFGAARDAGRSLRVLRVLGAPVDHPYALDHPEGEYLCGLLLEA